ncbi:hypothetical protein [Rufibacter latericius]|uniref:hypothetical protein n=1 Tax=Rufibacter latericius TaxID=2487040 RepID=UPI000F62BCE3|nr:hypothetical protein [Rufibacter latericius]
MKTAKAFPLLFHFLRQNESRQLVAVIDVRFAVVGVITNNLVSAGMPKGNHKGLPLLFLTSAAKPKWQMQIHLA